MAQSTFPSQNVKNIGVRTTFGRSDVEKVCCGAIELNMGTLQQTNTAMEYPRFGDHVVRESHGFP